jgi:glycosyltransferase involved in cell wall biosynthesis
MSRAPALSIVLPTYNRSADLPRAVESVLQQTASPDVYELIVVDNNSADATSDLIAELSRQHHGRVSGVLEKRQGVSHARNTGIAGSRAGIVAFVDDDVRVAPDWVETILRAFGDDPQLECIGGKVLPEWPGPPPRWLTRAHWAPLALQDFGDSPMVLSPDNPKGLISANLACRRAVLERVGGFSPTFQRVGDGIGSLEDDEWIRRLWKAGGRALYVPELVAYTAVPGDRLTRAYHRRWHRGHGGFYALLHADEVERTSRGSLLGVPAHMYRAGLEATAGWMSAALRGRMDQAFLHEVKLCFIRGFVARRFTERRYS